MSTDRPISSSAIADEEMGRTHYYERRTKLAASNSVQIMYFGHGCALIRQAGPNWNSCLLILHGLENRPASLANSRKLRTD